MHVRRPLMKHSRIVAPALLGLCAAVSFPLLAQNPTPKEQKPALEEKAPAKGTLDKPVTDFKLKDLTHEKKEGEKEDAAFIALSQFKDKKSVVLFFLSEQCGTTWKYEKRVGKLMQ